MPRPEDTPRPEDLVEEFGGLLTWYMRAFGWRYLGGLLDEDDLRQAAIVGLLSWADKFAGVTDRQDRGLLAFKAFRSGMGFDHRQVDAAHKHGVQVLSGDRPVDVFEQTLIDRIETDETGYEDVELELTLCQLLPEREHRMVNMRLDGYTWREIGQEVGFAGAPNVAGASARAALFTALRKVGIFDLDDLEGVLDDRETARRDKASRFEAQAKRSQTHCVHGHSLDDAYLSTRGDGNVRRDCRTCKLDRQAATRKRASSLA